MNWFLELTHPWEGCAWKLNKFQNITLKQNMSVTPLFCVKLEHGAGTWDCVIKCLIQKLGLLFSQYQSLNTISQPFKLDTASGVGAGRLLQKAGRILTGKMSSSCVCRVRKCVCEDGR